tara:strand:- start:276 stop:935 length:660 start_codon:yes stop_codon:yes gene_type:complete
MSERLLGAVVGMHGDDNGLIMPPSVAPFQVIVMPIAAHSDPNVITAVENLSERLQNLGIRVELDVRDVRPGVKHFDWEIKGAPLRVELGPRDLASGKCIVSLRTGGKVEVKLDDAPSKIIELLESVSDELRLRAEKLVSELVKPFPLENISHKGSIEDEIEDGIVYELPFSGNDSDAEILEKKTGLTLLGECDSDFDSQKPCVITGNLTTKRQFLARMY